jgi:hypothetical protein
MSLTRYATLITSSRVFQPPRVLNYTMEFSCVHGSDPSDTKSTCDRRLNCIYIHTNRQTLGVRGECTLSKYRPPNQPTAKPTRSGEKRPVCLKPGLLLFQTPVGSLGSTCALYHSTVRPGTARTDWGTGATVSPEMMRVAYS